VLGPSKNRQLDLLVADLREQLQRVAVILSEEAQRDDEPGSSTDGEVRSTPRWWSLRDRFSTDDLQSMIDLYRSGTTAKQIAEKFGVSVCSVTRLLHQHGAYVERAEAGTQQHVRPYHASNHPAAYSSAAEYGHPVRRFKSRHGMSDCFSRLEAENDHWAVLRSGRTHRPISVG
jgi:Helix-turn-helix domain of resolvase